jgi:mitochondrial fission protein ELM1
LILIGGPSKIHRWDEAAVVEAVNAIVGRCGDRPWRITDSRRSPGGTLDRITRACPGIAGYPHGSTGAEWLPQRLAEAAEVWVTSDSISMIYESLSSGARVGLIPTPLKKPGRVSRGVDRLVEEGWITPFDEWLGRGELPAPPRILREADRCAALVLERYFPGRLP